ncbi:GtrA family protein [Agarivorans sp. B2Z047]|uniref:GtrA family protein n=1 Tax=Agarivorans sp. B2Z047 TaxID=2652721 RepID=UPI00128B3810|nr:GtrA family protein [Agarivorans sp. B2Z047]MPW31293.1 GtrA family protein [Agarivorans sp. B2Z047]UQN42742.1 GtrA family protein [Agarivorans sp. B2Z047]
MAHLIAKLFSLRIARYGLTGVIATTIHFVLALAVLQYWPQAFALANFVGFSLAFVFSYLLQTCWVFQNQPSLNNALRFFVVQTSALCLSILLSSLLNDFSNIIKVAVVIVLLPLVTFVIHRCWTYSQAETHKP